ncbi:MAG: HAD family phosphatase [Planctomycetota bacterium]|nr:HAD family phosphatase [Planctomycetota bacterium]
MSSKQFIKSSVVPLDLLRRMINMNCMSNKDNDMGVIFDLDGVLVDTGWAHKQSWFDLAEKEGFSISDEFFYSTFGMQNYMIIPMLIGQELPRDEVDRMADWKEQRYREIIADHLEPAEGARSLLGDLKDSGFLTAVGSSAPRANLDLVLERVNLRDCFDACVSGEQVSHGKPAPDTFLKAAEELSLPPGRCAVVEDAVQGVEAGKAAGMPVAAVTTTRKRADLTIADIIVDSLTELTAADFVELLTNQGQ